jgi:hypothetical protein
MGSTKTFAVSIDEIGQHFVFGDTFSDGYTRTIAMSDGSVRTIVLRPMMKDGELVMELKDGTHLSYMGPNGKATHGTLMISLTEIPIDDPSSSTR